MFELKLSSTDRMLVNMQNVLFVRTESTLGFDTEEQELKRIYSIVINLCDGTNLTMETFDEKDFKREVKKIKKSMEEKNAKI